MCFYTYLKVRLIRNLHRNILSGISNAWIYLSPWYLCIYSICGRLRIKIPIKYSWFPFPLHKNNQLRSRQEHALFLCLFTRPTSRISAAGWIVYIQIINAGPLVWLSQHKHTAYVIVVCCIHQYLVYATTLTVLVCLSSTAVYTFIQWRAVLFEL